MPKETKAKQTHVFDSGAGHVQGLLERVTDAGHRSYWFRYEVRGVKKWIALADEDERLSLKDAREKAQAMRARVAKARRGESTYPHEDERKRRETAAKAGVEITFEKVALAWTESQQFAALRQATRREYGRVVRKLLVPAFGQLDPKAIPREAVVAFLFDLRDGTKKQRRFTLNNATKDREPAGFMANRVRAILGSAFRWATAEDQRKLYGSITNPVLGLERIFEEPEPEPRVFTNDELRRIFAARIAPGAEELQHLVPLIAYTLTRSNEARGAQWSEIDWEDGHETWTIPPERSKDKRPHVVPLSEGALRVLWAMRAEQKVVDIKAAGFLFPAETREKYMDQPQDSIRELRRVAEVEDFTLHPLRDTAAHWLAEELRVRGDVVEDLLSHTPTRLERTYRGGRRSSLADMREALDLWSGKLDEILGVAKAKKRKKTSAKERA